MNPEFSYFPDERPAVMVVSHERSGTHFLMNTLAACYGYVSQPWIDLDAPAENILRLYDRPKIRDILLDMAKRPLANLVKSHHAADFFTGELPRVLPRYVVFVIYRDPVPVMVSFWRYLHKHFPGDPVVLWQSCFESGPKVADPLTFAGAAPAGRVLRYQVQQHATMIQRWAAHVRGWLAVAAEQPRVVPVRYEDLDVRYEDTVRTFANVLGRPPQALVRPARDVNVISGGPADPLGTGVAPDLEALRRYCRAEAGDTMALLGY